MRFCVYFILLVGFSGGGFGGDLSRGNGGVLAERAPVNHKMDLDMLLKWCRGNAKKAWLRYGKTKDTIETELAILGWDEKKECGYVRGRGKLRIKVGAVLLEDLDDEFLKRGKKIRVKVWLLKDEEGQIYLGLAEVLERDEG